MRDEAISTDRVLSGPRLLLFARNDDWSKWFNLIGICSSALAVAGAAAALGR